MVERESFLFYRAYLNAANRMTLEQRARFYEIIFAYGLDGILPEDTGDPLIDMALDFIRPLIGANIKNYMNGCKGGAPSESMKGNQNARKNKPKTNPKQTENKGNVNVKDNVKVNDKAKDKVNDKDKEKVAAPISYDDDFVSEEEWQKRLSEQDDDW